MTATVVDLWRLLNDHESRTVVMLDHSDVTGDVRFIIKFCFKRNVSECVIVADERC